ncbi:biotin-protein ligase [Radiomyces spectabilis]|uniref:biotin-protein ligase n=1 Tax=Radiomyces spectabilis TaxID=64574 RepID=UPI00222066B4|nr:biotin-protein ligase [Radiomyces spectabilis]KAI8379644.1 biotin-protein ligase [Radiomyces spectabilis]
MLVTDACSLSDDGRYILVYSGPGTSPNSVHHIFATIKTMFGQTYNIRSVDARLLRLESWEKYCAMLVMPGGRDLPYCEELDGKANDRIRHYVEQGGRYLGICAGAYYGCATIEFEKGRPYMEVCGSRELGFFPGLSRGSMFPGFVYNTEHGARAVEMQICEEAFRGNQMDPADLPETVTTYYNGGGYFAHADRYEGVDILARFMDRGICTDETSCPAAAIYCQRGFGHVVLISTHPEYSILSIDGRLLPTMFTTTEDRLMYEAKRKSFLQAVFQKMNLYP